MSKDMYLKVVLTVIAICLTWVCLRDLRFTQVAQAETQRFRLRQESLKRQQMLAEMRAEADEARWQALDTWAKAQVAIYEWEKKHQPKENETPDEKRKRELVNAVPIKLVAIELDKQRDYLEGTGPLKVSVENWPYSLSVDVTNFPFTYLSPHSFNVYVKNWPHSLEYK